MVETNQKFKVLGLERGCVQLRGLDSPGATPIIWRCGREAELAGRWTRFYIHVL